jgi:hypothetical protein
MNPSHNLHRSEDWPFRPGETGDKIVSFYIDFLLCPSVQTVLNSLRTAHFTFLRIDIIISVLKFRNLSCRRLKVIKTGAKFCRKSVQNDQSSDLNVYRVAFKPYQFGLRLLEFLQVWLWCAVSSFINVSSSFKLWRTMLNIVLFQVPALNSSQEVHLKEHKISDQPAFGCRLFMLDTQRKREHV